MSSIEIMSDEQFERQALEVSGVNWAPTDWHVFCVCTVPDRVITRRIACNGRKSSLSKKSWDRSSIAS